MWRVLIIFIMLFSCGSARAASYEQARKTLNAGHYDQAHVQALALESHQGWALAAEALNAKLLLGMSRDPTKTAKQAMTLAGRSLQMDSSNGEAQLQYAIAYGFYGRQVSPFKAWRKKLPLKILTEINKARSAAPQDARTLALLGAWHLSVVQRAGVKTAKKLYGANEEDGRNYFEQARKMDASDLIVLANYTLMRYVLNPKAEEKLARENLQKIISAPVTNAVEAKLQIQMQSILASFDKNTKGALTAKQFITR